MIARPSAEARIFLDATVLFSAALGGAGSSKLWKLRGVRLVTNEYALVETHQNLALRSGPKLLELLDRLIENVEVNPYSPELPARYASEIANLPDEDDAPILAGAIDASCDFLVTLDSDCFGDLFGQTIRGVTVLKPGKLLDRFGV